jgi:EAL domain-containing protein (putative c-di-GMP-specific phosphodiesterase class I)
MAMYQVKESGRNAVRFFDPDMQQAVETRALLESDLRQAVLHQQLQLHYQIQVDNKRRPIGAEALLRWIHPIRGMVSPAQFIPIAEQTSVIIEIGDWVLDLACRQLAAWSNNEQAKHLTLAVNVSAHQFTRPDFVSKVEDRLRTYGLDPSRLKLELTESVVLTNVAEVISKMHTLKALRVKLSLDDFGTGYSSLSYLKQLPLDQLKIDQSFVRNMTTDTNDAVMVQTIVDLAKNFRLNVIAEGVETEEKFSLLEHQGCLTYQGYLFSRPVPISQFEELLKQS